MTVKQTLLAHIREMHHSVHHRQPTERTTLIELQRWHAREHHRYRTNHYHEGRNDGADVRPAGWYTGEGAVARSTPWPS